MGPLLTGIPIGLGFLVLGLIFSTSVGLGVLISCDHSRACEEEDRFVGDCSAASLRLILCILKHINILGDLLYFEVIALDFIMQHQEVEGMATCAPHLEVVKKRLWHNVSVKRLRVSEFLHPCILDDGEDELRRLLPRRLVGVTVGVLGFVHRFRARAGNSRGIFTDCCFVGANSCGFGKFRAIS